MKIVSNDKKIAVNRKVGLYASLGSLVVLVLGFVLSLTPERLGLAYGALLLGLITSQVGIYFGNRWGRSPRIDERISNGLKGLDDRFTLYHYMTKVSHVLVGPAGIWVIVPQYQSGTISFENKRFKQSGVFLLTRLFAQEGIGRPETEARVQVEDFQKFLNTQLADGEAVQAKPVIVFVNPKVKVDASVAESALPAMHVEKLKDFMRRKLKEQPLALPVVKQVEAVLPDEGIA